jgi:hypothetical protein
MVHRTHAISRVQSDSVFKDRGELFSPERAAVSSCSPACCQPVFLSFFLPGPLGARSSGRRSPAVSAEGARFLVANRSSVNRFFWLLSSAFRPAPQWGLPAPGWCRIHVPSSVFAQGVSVRFFEMWGKYAVPELTNRRAPPSRPGAQHRWPPGDGTDRWMLPHRAQPIACAAVHHRECVESINPQRIHRPRRIRLGRANGRPATGGRPRTIFRAAPGRAGPRDRWRSARGSRARGSRDLARASCRGS